MKELPNFKIHPNGEISKEFLKLNILTFKEATEFIRKMKYGRNENKNNLKTVFVDNCGTCSTKHSLIKKLADENNFSEIKLVLGIFKMNSSNTKEIRQTLKTYNLEYLPEAHNYLKYDSEIYDFTKKDSKPTDFINELLEEIEIKPEQITNFKVNYHKEYLAKWLTENKKIKFTLNEIWKIREKCIENLTEN
ncbi:hypothetical protein [Kaistella carnis]|uniref:hypothetical protein n=1 Tax=Kaistella carnis TaxID=1241979 RepID=UPI0028B00F36|nr:hypothetical protein [Kaistella carnis]